jgi:putative transposase
MKNVNCRGRFKTCPFNKIKMKNRKLNRLEDYDYSQNGMYFVTICTKDRIECFGEIKEGEMILSEAGKIIEQQLKWLENRYEYISIDCDAVMPNHLHLILEIISRVGTGRDLSLQMKIKSLSELIGAFKTTSSKLIHQKGILDFQWQRSFCDHIIRNEESLSKIREYIQTNPKTWKWDRNNVENIWM